MDSCDLVPGSTCYSFPHCILVYAIGKMDFGGLDSRAVVTLTTVTYARKIQNRAAMNISLIPHLYHSRLYWKRSGSSSPHMWAHGDFLGGLFLVTLCCLQLLRRSIDKNCSTWTARQRLGQLGPLLWDHLAPWLRLSLRQMLGKAQGALPASETILSNFVSTSWGIFLKNWEAAAHFPYLLSLRSGKPGTSRHYHIEERQPKSEVMHRGVEWRDGQSDFFGQFWTEFCHACGPVLLYFLEDDERLSLFPTSCLEPTEWYQ